MTRTGRSGQDCARAVQGHAAGIGLGVHVESQIDEHLASLISRFRRPLIRDSFHPADSRRHLQRGDM
jgi:hypothetical protein